MNRDDIYIIAKAWLDKDHENSSVDWIALMADDLARRLMSTPSISYFVNRTKQRLIGYHAFYKNGSIVFNEDYDDINFGSKRNPLIDIKQVGI